METNIDVLQKLKGICKLYGWDTIEIVSTLNGRPVYELPNSNIPNGAKTGRPHLYSATTDGMVFELDSDEIHTVIVSYNGLRERV
jgi:hypothetical protein